MKRCFIVVGDLTTQNGTVLEGVQSSFHHGKSLSYHGARIYCPSCKSEGYITGVGPYRPTTLMGKQVALENDLCICKCNPPPRLIASQHTASMSFEAHELAAKGYAPDGSSLPKAAAFDDRFVLRDDNGEPIPNTCYLIHRESSAPEHGQTNAQGCTHLLAEAVNAENIRIYLAHAA